MPPGPEVPGALGIERALAAGLGLGADVALKAARRHPGRFVGIVRVGDRPPADPVARAALAEAEPEVLVRGPG